MAYDDSEKKAYPRGMMGGTLMGTVGGDAELRYTKDGQGYAKFAVAVDHVDKGERVTNWWHVTLWGTKSYEKGGDAYNNNFPEWAEASIRSGDFFASTDTHAEPRKYQDRDGVEKISLDARILGKIESKHPKDRPKKEDKTVEAPRKKRKPVAVVADEFDEDDAPM